MSMFEAVLMGGEGGGGGLWAFGGSAVRLRGRRTVVRWASWTGPNLLNQTTSHQPVESQESIHLLPPLHVFEEDREIRGLALTS